MEKDLPGVIEDEFYILGQLHRKSLRNNPSEISNYLADFDRVTTSEWEESVKLMKQKIKKAYDKGARTAGLSNVMAYIYDQQNQKSEAIRFYKEALQQDSSLVDVYTRLADLEPGNSDWYKKKAQAWK